MGAGDCNFRKTDQACWLLLHSLVLLKTWNVKGSPSRAQHEPGLAGLILQALQEILFAVSEQGNVAVYQLQLFRVEAPS